MPGAGHKDEQDPNLKPLDDPDAKASVLPSPTAPAGYRHPSADDFALPSTGATPNLDLELDGTNYKEELNLQKLPQRRRRALRPRNEGNCKVWLPNFADLAGLSQSAVNTLAHPLTKPAVDGIIPKLNAVDPSNAGIATVSVTQYAKAPSDSAWTLDISILAPDGTLLNNMLNVKVRPHEEVEVKVPWGVELGQDAPTVKIPNSDPLYVSVGDAKGPLPFRYGDEGIANFGEGFGLNFDSDNKNPEHQCVDSGWVDEKRTIQCLFTVVHD